MRKEAVIELILSMPEAAQSSHFGTTDFRVRGKIFVTSPKPEILNFKLTPEQQEMLVETAGDMFSPIPNKWGQQGWTMGRIDKLDEPTALSALWMAWANVAPRTLAKAHGR